MDKKYVLLQIVHRKGSQNMCKYKLFTKMDHKICESINCAQKWITKCVMCRYKLCTERDHNICASINCAQKWITKCVQV